MGWKLCNEKPDVFLLMIGRFFGLCFSFLFFFYPQNAFATTKKLQIDAIYTLSFSFSDNIELCNFLVSIGVRLIFFFIVPAPAGSCQYMTPSSLPHQIPLQVQELFTPFLKLEMLLFCVNECV